jgi:opacity protein-like surface antigen
MRRTLATRVVMVGLATLAFSAVTRDASAQGFISPIFGYNFGGDAGCLEITDCEDKRLNIGVGFGAMGPILGFEGEIAFVDNFFGETPELASDVMTFMGNFMIVPKLGPVRPYGTVGVGIIKTSAEFTSASLLDADSTDFGWNIGGGVMILFGEHVGIRGDFRYFHAFQALEILGIDLDLGDDSRKLDFGRAGIGAVFAF